MYYTGFADEAASGLDGQIKATKELGWKNIETRKLFNGNLASISDAEFAEVCEKLQKAKVSFNCFGSGVANWAKPITEAPDTSYDEMRKAVPRMQKLGIKMIRIMSFAVPKEVRDKDFSAEVIKRMKVIAKIAEDGGVTCVLENCMNWGGLSYEHTLKLVEGVKSPSFKLVYDTGNPVSSEDVRGKPPYKFQSSWEFYKAVREHVVYIHIKDGKMGADGKVIYTFPGEGDGDVRKILEDMFTRGYDGGISIEPHMVAIYHDKGPTKEELMYVNYVEYGQRIMKMVDEIRKEIPTKK
ncbi:MAG: hypothetical protein A2X48_12200 [Lentisphaerae bacterium GWF2_49_21]|nr:MAG: hypothetical protein A2X48_12200 [Lentisphaerae bacterium GWF2_49_21]